MYCGEWELHALFSEGVYKPLVVALVLILISSISCSWLLEFDNDLRMVQMHVV